MHGARSATWWPDLLEASSAEINFEAFAVDCYRLDIVKFDTRRNRVVLIAGVAFEVAEVDGFCIFDVVTVDGVIGKDDVNLRTVGRGEVCEPKETAAVVKFVNRGGAGSCMCAADEHSGRQ